MIELINDDCTKVVNKIMEEYDYDKVIFVSDPPFNIGYKYNTYKDKMKENEYFDMLNSIFGKRKSVLIHYPEHLHKYSIKIGKAPEKVVSWVYNSNTGKQHRDIAFYGIKPNMGGGKTAL